MNEHTPAGRHLADLKRQYPLHARAGAGRVEGLFQRLLPDLPAKVQRWYETGDVAVGGTNRPLVMVHTFPVGTQRVIEMTSQFMRFLYAVLRTIAGNTNVETLGESTVEASLSWEQMLKDLKEIAGLWKSKAVWEQAMVAYPSPALHFKQRKLAEQWTQCTEMFILAHEAGHVMAALAREECTFPPNYDDDPAEELWCDAFGMETMLKFGRRIDPRGEAGDMRHCYAGAIFALRLFSWLERLGVKFNVMYPPADRRVEYVRKKAQELLGMQGFRMASPIGQAMNDLLLKVEDEVLGVPENRTEPLEDLVVRVQSVIEEVTHQRLDRQAAITKLDRMLLGQSLERLNELACDLYADYVSLGDDQPSPTLQLNYRIGRELLAIAPSLAEPARGIFQKVFQ
ncbi:MAG: hypothetical protein QM703_25295 [Gemmatales bacterium]